MNIGSVVDFPGRKTYCVLSIDVICRNLASINRSHSFIAWHINLMPRWLLHFRISHFPLYSGTILFFLHISGTPCCSTWFMASNTYIMSCFASILTASMGRSSGHVVLSSPIFPGCSDTSFSLNMSIGPSVAKPLSICFLVFSVLSYPSKHVSHMCMISLPTVSIWPSKLLMKDLSQISFDFLSLVLPRLYTILIPSRESNFA